MGLTRKIVELHMDLEFEFDTLVIDGAECVVSEVCGRSFLF